MILEYRDEYTDDVVWHMVESDHIATSRFYIWENTKKLSEKFGNDLYDNLQNLKIIAKEKMNKVGYGSSFRTFFHVRENKKVTDVEEIDMVVLMKSRNAEIHFFDLDYPYRICYKDGTIMQESSCFIN